jgi:hypothetical protein
MTELMRYEAARRALAEAHRVDEVKDIKDKAEALRHYARQRSDNELETRAAEIKLRAIRRIGELSRELEKSQPRENNGRLATSGKTAKAKILKEAGLSTSTAHRCEQIAEIPQAEFEHYIETKTTQRQSVSSKKRLLRCLGGRSGAKRRSSAFSRIIDRSMRALGSSMSFWLIRPGNTAL